LRPSLFTCKNTTYFRNKNCAGRSCITLDLGGNGMTVKEKNELIARASNAMNIGESLAYLGLFVVLVSSAALLCLEVE